MIATDKEDLVERVKEITGSFLTKRVSFCTLCCIGSTFWAHLFNLEFFVNELAW